MSDLLTFDKTNIRYMGYNEKRDEELNSIEILKSECNHFKLCSKFGFIDIYREEDKNRVKLVLSKKGKKELIVAKYNHLNIFRIYYICKNLTKDITYNFESFFNKISRDLAFLKLLKKKLKELYLKTFFLWFLHHFQMERLFK